MNAKTELYYAEMESSRNDAEAAYFDARPLLECEGSPVETFRAGFERAFRYLWNRSEPETTTAPAFLCNATRFKLAFGSHGETFAFAGYDKELHGKWVALVDATDGAHLRPAEKSSTAPPMRDRYPDTPRPELKSWRCFHCDEVITDPAKAKEHFRYSQYSKPACMINIEEYRRMERVHRAHCAEDTDLHRQISALHAEMATKVVQSEEDGYRRGLRDGRQTSNGSMREGATVRVPGVGDL